METRRFSSVLENTKISRYGLLALFIALLLNLFILVYPSIIVVLPTYPLDFLGRILMDTDRYLGSYLQFLATTWGRLAWILLVFVLFGLKLRDIGLKKELLWDGIKVTLILWGLIEGFLISYTLVVGEKVVINPV